MSNRSSIWTPSQALLDNSNIEHFLKFLKSRAVDLDSFVELESWSIRCNTEFWSALWDFCAIVGDKGTSTIQHSSHIIDTIFFPEAQLNYAENLLHYDGKDKPAIIFQAEDKIARQLSWDELKKSVAKVQQQLIQQGIKKGDRVAAVVANTPEAVIACLATVSLGAVWTSCSPDFGVNAIVERFKQVEPKLLFFTESYLYNGKEFSCIGKAEETMRILETCKVCVLVPLDTTATAKLPQHLDKDKFAHWQIWQDTKTVKPLLFTRVHFNEPLFIMYSSGTTGQPKCIVHGVGGTLIEHLKEHQLHCNIKPDDRVFYFTTCSWMMWNWQISALASKATLVLFDGSPFAGYSELLFDYADKQAVSLFGTSAKYLAVLEKKQVEIKSRFRLANLRTITSTGSPLLANSYSYVYEHIKTDVHLASISGGTDIIGCFILGCPNLAVTKAEIQCKSLGLDVRVFDDNGQAVVQQKGELVCCNAFPSMPIYFWQDSDDKTLYKKAYFKRFDNVWTHGDFIATTKNNGFVVYGRSDTVLNPGGVRIGTAEIYSCLENFKQIADCVVVGVPYQGDVQVLLFVVLAKPSVLDEALIAEIKNKIKLGCSPRHVPARIISVADIPKTRSGKTSEIAVKNVLTNAKINNLNSLSNPQSLEYFRNI